MDDWQADVLADALGERADGKWSAFEVALIVSRQNGKGSVLEARTLAGLTLFDERLILWSAHQTKTAFEAFRRMEELLAGSDDLRRRVKRISRANGDEGIELTNGARLRFVARSKGSGRGFSGDLIILDEAYALTSEQVEAMLPTLSARPNPQVWYTSSPPLDGVSGEPLYVLRERALTGDDSLTWLDWGLQGLDLDDVDKLGEGGWPLIDLDDRDLWYATNPALGIRIGEEFVSRERRSLSPTGFARERLSVWPRRVRQGVGVIRPESWADLAAPMTEADRPANAALALHVNAERTQAWIAYAGRDVDGMMRVGLTDRPWRPGQGLVDRVVDLRERRDPVAVVVDTRSERLLLDLEKAGVTASDDPDEPRAGDLVVPTAADTAAAFGLFVDTVRGEGLRHADDAPVNTALVEAKIRKLAGGLTWDGDVGPLKAVTLALWAFEARAHLLVGDLDEVGVW